MSMSEFEEQAEHRDCQAVSLGGRRVVLPPDFSEDELAFAQELDSLFPLPEEEIPPYFVHTLLEVEDPLFSPVDPEFEKRTSVRVFRRLNIQRRLFPRKAPHRLWSFHGPALSRRLLMAGASLLFFMVLTMAITAPSFASGLVILLRGVQSGVYPVHGSLTRPVITSSPTSSSARNNEISLLGVQQQLHFPLYWPTELPPHYTLSNIYLYSQQVRGWPVWTDGPMVEFRYSFFAPGDAAANDDQIAIREFKPRGEVYQVVEADAIHPLEVDKNGQAGAIYIDGQWVTLNSYSRRWFYNGHCELMTQRDGVVFWIAGLCSQETELNMQRLLSIANSLEVLHLQELIHAGVSLAYATALDHYMPGPFDGIILSLSADSNVGPYLRLVGPNQTQPMTGATHGAQHTQ
jgi:hypothetical protein